MVGVGDELDVLSLVSGSAAHSPSHAAWLTDGSWMMDPSVERPWKDLAPTASNIADIEMTTTELLVTKKVSFV